MRDIHYFGSIVIIYVYQHNGLTMIHYQITPINPNAHLFEVNLHISSPNKEQELWLPAWLPGSYMIRDFAKNIITIKATDEQGNNKSLTQLDKQRWLIATNSLPINICYQIYAWDLSVRTAFLDRRRGFFNGSSVFLAVKGWENTEHRVDILPSPHISCLDWKLATTLPRSSGDDYGFGSFYAKNYEELIDHPVEMGNFTLASFYAGDVQHDVVLAGKHHTDLERLCDDLKAICEYQITLFGTCAPFKRYLFMTAILDQGFGGLEHMSSTALMCSRSDLPLSTDSDVSKGYRTYLSLCSHEYFHSWNVKRIKPAVFLPYQLEAETYTSQLWAYEGITSYYDDFITYRAGRVNQTDYLQMLSELLTRVYRCRGRFKQSLTDSSLNAWTKFYKQDENAQNAIVSYYTKGALFALYLDLTLRHESLGKYNLDDLMQQLWQQYGLKKIGTNDNSHQQIISKLLNRSCDDIFAYLHSTDDLPLAPLFAKFGVNMKLRASTGTNDQGGITSSSPLTIGFGAKYKADPSGLLIQTVAENSSAMKSGLSAGDILLAVDGLKATENLDKALQQYQVDEQIELVWFRRDELMIGMLTIEAAPMDTVALEITDHNLVSAWLS